MLKLCLRGPAAAARADRRADAGAGAGTAGAAGVAGAATDCS